MPDKQITKDIWFLIILISVFATLAKSLNGFLNSKTPFNKREFMISLFVGSVSGFLFGLLGCFLFGNSQPAAGFISGAGAIIGIAGVARIAEVIETYIIKKFQ